MAQKKTIRILACLLAFLPIALTAKCPRKEDVTPCVCKDKFWEDNNPVGIECEEIDDKTLVKVANKLRGKTVDFFTIQDSELGSIPHDVFKGITFSELKIDSSTLVALTNKDQAFVGLEDHLVKLDIADSVIKNEWDWTVLRNLKKLKTLSIAGPLRLGTLGSDVMKSSVSSLEDISFIENDVSSVSDHAFESFTNIKNLALYKLKIKNVKRTMLPNPATQLTAFDISGNLIEQFPEDIFTNMPNLNRLNIGYNKILVLDEKTLSPVWEHLENFFTLGNKLRCDCSMSWLLKKKLPKLVQGNCVTPKQLEGKLLTKLESKDLVC